MTSPERVWQITSGGFQLEGYRIQIKYAGPPPELPFCLHDLDRGSRTQFETMKEAEHAGSALADRIDAGELSGKIDHVA